MFDQYPPKSVVVGIDGSQAAIRAARWAVDEVAGTNTPLRLLYVTQPDPDASPREAKNSLAAAEEVVHDAYIADRRSSKKWEYVAGVRNVNKVCLRGLRPIYSLSTTSRPGLAQRDSTQVTT